MEFCRAIFSENGEIQYEGAQAPGTDINTVVENDKRYGKMQPINGRYFTFSVEDVLGEEVTNKQIIKAITLAWHEWELRTNLDVRHDKSGARTDFRVLFRTVENDERKHLTNSTIMYHFFPIQSIVNENRGLCVVNSKFYYTADGNPLPMWIIDPIHYTKETTWMGSTIDLDQVFRHEFGHGIGLPHDPSPGNIMSTPHNNMSEHLSERDIYRGIQKHGYRKMKASKLVRLLKWIFHRSDNY